MQKIRNKIKFTLLIFLSFLSLFVDLLAGYIIIKYNAHHFIELSESHMEQQYQNLTQHMAVMGEYTRFFSENSQLVHSMELQNWSDVSGEISEFLRSTNEIVGGRIYVFTEDEVRCVVSNSIRHFIDMKPEELMDVLQRQHTNTYHSQWILRKGVAGEYNCLSFLFPIYKEDALLGFFLADVNWKGLVDKVIDNSNSFWEETLLVRTNNKIWNEDSPWNDIIDNRILSDDTNLFRNKTTVISFQKLNQSEDYFVQINSLKLYHVFIPLGATLFLLFLISVIIFNFFINTITNSIIIPLVNLQDKMNKTLNEVQSLDNKESERG